MLGKGPVAYIKGGDLLSREGDKIKIVDFRFENGQVVGLWEGGGRYNLPYLTSSWNQ